MLQGQILVQDSKEELLAAVGSLEVDREKLRARIDELRNTIDNAEKGKKWVDWLGDFDSKIDSLRSENDVEARLLFLQEVVEKIYVKTLDKKANLIELDIRFKLPYIGDALNRRSDLASEGYELIEGGKSLKKEFTRIDGRKCL